MEEVVVPDPIRHPAPALELTQNRIAGQARNDK